MGRRSRIKHYLEFLGKYMPEANRADSVLELGYLSAQALVQVLKQCVTISRAQTS
jgi:branched-chain amino acid transport system substrate-binding protein